MLRVTIQKKVGDLAINAEFMAKNNEIVALFGRSGSGKTSIINLLAGLLKPSKGTISFNSHWIFNSYLGINRPPEKRRFGYVFQEARLFPHLSVYSNLNYGFKLLPSDKRRIKFEQVVDLLQIEHLLERHPQKLSGGEKQRVAIGRALLMSPHLLLMDEPLAALDDYCKSEILPFIKTASADLSVPVVYVSHSLDEIRQLTERIVLVKEGSTTMLSPIEQLQKDMPKQWHPAPSPLLTA